MQQFNCPVCGSSLKKAGQTSFCSCGWSKSFNQKAKQSTQRKIAKNIIIAGFGLMAGIVYIGSWGSASLEIAPLKVRQWTGQLNASSADRLKNICMKSKKYDCVEKAQKSFFQSSGDIKALEELGEFQYRRHKFDQAEQTYHQYFTKKGTSVKSAYNYARLLEKKGKKEHAISYYQYALKTRPHSLQVTVMRSYIDLLVQMGKTNQARQELSRLKPMITRAGSLAQQEYNRWNKQVNG